jgi:hypothetical protein
VLAGILFAALKVWPASLFATEGIASVGTSYGILMRTCFRPWKSIICRSAPRFILGSGAIVPQILLNVPLSTVLLTHGLNLLFLLWYITPRGIFEPNAIERTHNDQ